MPILIINGCAFSQVRLRGLVSKGLLIPGTSEDPAYRFYLGVACVRTSGWNGCERKDREKTVDKLFSDACGELKPEIYQESYVPQTPNDPKSVFPVWVVKINCIAKK
jgi:hypothetical protein